MSRLDFQEIFQNKLFFDARKMVNFFLNRVGEMADNLFRLSGGGDFFQRRLGS